LADAEALPPDPPTTAEASACTCLLPIELAAAPAEADPNLPLEPLKGPYPGCPPVELAVAEAEPVALDAVALEPAGPPSPP
jgi:hypothetical protein